MLHRFNIAAERRCLICETELVANGDRIILVKNLTFELLSELHSTSLESNVIEIAISGEIKLLSPLSPF